MKEELLSVGGVAAICAPCSLENTGRHVTPIAAQRKPERHDGRDEQRAGGLRNRPTIDRSGAAGWSVFSPEHEIGGIHFPVAIAVGWHPAACAPVFAPP